MTNIDVRLFGGPADGQLFSVNRGQTVVRVLAPPKDLTSRAVAWNEIKPNECVIVDQLYYYIHGTDAWGTWFYYAVQSDNERNHVELCITLLVWMSLTADGWRKERETIASGRYVS